MSFPFLTISSDTDNLNTGSYFDSTDLSTFYVSQSTDNFFGSSYEDFIEFSVFDISGNQINWNILKKTDTYNIVSSNYIDVTGSNLSYNYPRYNSSYAIASNREILLNTVNDLTNVGIQTGNQIVSYNFLRNVAGDSNNLLVIKSISTDRTEIQLIPTFVFDATNPQSILINNWYDGFCQKKTMVNDIINLLISALDNFNINDGYNTLIKSNPQVLNSFKTIFGLSSNSDIINFLNGIYNGYNISYKNSSGIIVSKTYLGIKSYITNWLHTYYADIVSEEELHAQFQFIVDTSVNTALIARNYNYGNLDSSGSVANFIDNIFFNNFLSPELEVIFNQYTDKFYSYLKNALNFGNNVVLPIIDHTYTLDDNNDIILVAKLFSPLGESISPRNTCWVSNISIAPLIQKVILTQPSNVVKYKIAGPNFNANPKIKTKPITKTVDYTNQNQLNSSNLQNQIEFNKKLQALSVDYSSFSNFVLFSSAQLRIKLFVNKVNQLNSLTSSLNNVQISASSENYSVSSSFSYDTTSLTEKIDAIYKSFDGFESYLYTNQYLISGSNYQNYIRGAIDYDFNNRDAFVNNTPEFIKSNDDNSDYLVFLSMVGHFFDNIYLYIQNFPTTQYLSNSNSNSFVSTIANNLLEQFGWNPISSVENVSRESYYLNNAQYSGSQAISGVNKMNIIWNRILNNLPMIYKAKGTEESVRILANIYGIPYSFLNIKEFGGNSLSDYDNSSYLFQSRYYFTSYSGSSEYVQLPYNPSVQSMEFKFSFDSTHQYNWNDVIQLVYKDQNFQVFVTKAYQDYMGILSFSFYDQTISTQPLPLFNGDVFNVLIQQRDVTSEFDVVYTNVIPSIYSLQVNSVENDRVIFQSSNELLLGSQYIGYFTSSNSVCFGNTPYGNNNFFGNLDKINIWNYQLSQSAFIDHCKNFDAYDDYDPTNTYTHLYFRYSFEYPINLASASMVSVPNAIGYNGLTGSAYNFPYNTLAYVSSSCLYVPISSYPFQFDEFDITQNVNLSNFGPNKLKNYRINKVAQTALARLMPTELSTTPVLVSNDSNLVAAYISPYVTRDSDILNFIGNYDIMNIVGDPSYLYSSSYDALEKLRDDYNNYNLAEPILYQEFFTIYKLFIDSSFFDSIKRLTPARSKLITGTLIEQSLIERNKYQNIPIQSNNIGVLPFTPSQSLYDITANSIIVNNAPITMSIPTQITNGYEKISTRYISNDKVDARFSSLSINGNCLIHPYNNGFITQSVYKLSKNVHHLNYIPLGLTNGVPTPSEYTYVTQSVNFYNFASGNNFLSGLLDKALYPVGHYSLNRNRHGLSFSTTNLNTVDASGSLDGSSPIEVTAVNQNTSIQKLVSV
jgi:hypothetical protein